ncbi:hypothetical protein BMS3Abin15_00247 [bacterium BMS3Abin15]|nr:hypothetical protein BMS3Abin15_00247 [bacterium BMS3Abin15]
MAIKPVCDKCKNELNDFGGILFSPPDEESRVKKFHLCKDCYKKIVDSFSEGDSN